MPGDDGRMPTPTTVWMVALGRSPDEVKGTLSLDTEAVVFTPEVGGTPIRIVLAETRTVRRLRISPVLIVRQRGGDRTAFFFAQPPPLGQRDPDPEGVSLRSARRTGKRRQQRRNSSYLAANGHTLKPTLIAWASELAAAVAASRR